MEYKNDVCVCRERHYVVEFANAMKKLIDIYTAAEDIIKIRKTFIYEDN